MSRDEESWRGSVPRGHHLDGGRFSRRATGLRGVFGYPDAGEQESVNVSLAEQTRDEAIDERHTARRRAEGVGDQVQPPSDQASGKLSLGVVAVGGGRDLGSGDDDERRV